MNRLVTACFIALFSASAVSGAPLCPEFASPDLMPKKYRKLAPVLSGAPSDWIITVDQMDVDYVPSAEAADLLSRIVAEFEARGTKLAILMAPPRPLIAGQSALEALTDGPSQYNVDEVSASFNQMIETIRKTGAIAPNLLEVATRDLELQDAFYYRHDTHWTPRGAAESAVALAEAVIADGSPAFIDRHVVRPKLDTDDIFSERGSLADMTKAVCGVQIAPVDLAIPAFPKPAELGLLDETSSRPKVILAGSSFSNRYKRDSYRVGDAIGGALQADVVNHSVSGGGAIGAVEGIVNTHLVEPEALVDLVVWEIPYTEGLKNVGMLRQLLGALQFNRKDAAALTVNFDPSGKTKIKLDELTPDVLALTLPNSKLQRAKVDLRFSDGSKQTLNLTRKNHVPAALQSDFWAVSLLGLHAKGLDSLTLRYSPTEIGGSAKVQLF